MELRLEIAPVSFNKGEVELKSSLVRDFSFSSPNLLFVSLRASFRTIKTVTLNLIQIFFHFSFVGAAVS